MTKELFGGVACLALVFGMAPRAFAVGLDADFDLDGDVDSIDFSIWESAYAIGDVGGDADGDGDTDGDDFLIWQADFPLIVEEAAGAASVAAAMRVTLGHPPQTKLHRVELDGGPMTIVYEGDPAIGGGGGFASVSAVPEPGSFALLVAALLGAIGMLKRRRG